MKWEGNREERGKKKSERKNKREEGREVQLER